MKGQGAAMIRDAMGKFNTLGTVAETSVAYFECLTANLDVPVEDNDQTCRAEFDEWGAAVEAWIEVSPGR